jgi:glucose/arabinose dehydrogenase
MAMVLAHLRRLALVGLVCAPALGSATAQTAQPAPTVPPGTPQAPGTPAPPAEPTAVQVLIEAGAQGATCRPPVARLPPQTLIRLQIVNRSTTPAVFGAPEFFRRAKVEDLTFAKVRDEGSITTAGGVVSEIRLVTPEAGKYPYNCVAVTEGARVGQSAEGVFEVTQ